MLIEKTKDIQFDQKSYEEWQKIASESLKGLPFDRLITKTIEGIDLYPLYTEDSPKLASLGAIREAKSQFGWTIAQSQYASDADTFLHRLEESFQRGNEAIVYEGSAPIDWDAKNLQKLAEFAVTYPLYFYDVKSTDLILKVFDYIEENSKDQVTGVVEIEGNREVLKDYKNIRTIGANVVEVHHLGADAVTELALVLAKAVAEANRLQSFNALSEQFFVRFAVDTHFFMEIAKLRACRVLWEALSTAYEETTVHIPLITETSKRSFSTLDPYVNLLRAGNSAFSAVLGGTDILTVHPHDVLTNPGNTSIRLARNIQLVIKEETLVSEVLDPSGGSYFIESLTKELVEKAWALFIEIEALGGYETYINSDDYKTRLETLHQARLEAVAETKHSLVGTNVYADLDANDKIEAELEVAGRLAKPFEQFRKTFKSAQPAIALLTFGELKDFKARADFISGFFATGGLKTTWSPAFETVEEALDWVKENEFNHLVICATNDRTKEVVLPFLRGCSKELTVDVAGKYDKALAEEWQHNGLNGFIYQGLNRLEKFTEIYNRWKGESLHETT